jgi:hypothetical protein
MSPARLAETREMNATHFPEQIHAPVEGEEMTGFTRWKDQA